MIGKGHEENLRADLVKDELETSLVFVSFQLSLIIPYKQNTSIYVVVISLAQFY